MSRDEPHTDADETDRDEPTLTDRVEASEDFSAALEQSMELLSQYRRLVFLLVLASLLVAAFVIGYPYVR